MEHVLGKEMSHVSHGGGVQWAEVRELRPMVLLLAALESAGQGLTVLELCGNASLGRSACDRSLRVLQDCGLVWRVHRRFGRPGLVALTDTGRNAARHARLLVGLLRGETPPA